LALADDHVNAAADPLVIVLGMAPKLTVGTMGTTEIDTDCVAVPPPPAQINV
jgi:hypothetical protein